MNKIKRLLDVVDANRDYISLGLLSDPGLSKTSQINQWAQAHNRKVFEFITSQRMPSEISGMPMPVTETKKMEIFDFNLLLDMKDGDILFFDEFTNGNIMTLNACLTLIQERKMLSGKKLPSIIVVAAGNPQGSCDLLPQTKQRFIWSTVKFHRESWRDYIQDTWGVTPTKELMDVIEKQYQDGFNKLSDASYNYATARTVENYIRIAKGIKQDDPFWRDIEISNALVAKVYKTISEKDTFGQAKRICMNKALELDLVYETCLAEFVDTAANWKSLASVIETMEENVNHLKAYDEFINWARLQPDTFASKEA